MNLSSSSRCAPSAIRNPGINEVAKHLARFYHIICYSHVMVEPAADPILRRFRSALADLYGDRLDQVVLFGSRARGGARPDSDYDVAVFLWELPDRWSELDRMADLRVRFLDETGAFFDARPYASASYREASPLMAEIRHDGLRL